ncbi:MAG: glycosyltransferase [Nitrososphaeria archaeon]
MNIGVIGMDLNPPLNEGIKNTVYEIYKRIIKRGIEVLLITRGMLNGMKQPHHNNMEVLEYEGLKIYPIPIKQGTIYTHLTGAPSFIATLPIYLRKICDRTPIELFHVHTSFATVNSFIALQLKSLFILERPKVVITQYSSICNPYVFGEFDFKSLLVPLLMNYKILKCMPADLVITLNKRARYSFKKHFAKKVAWFPHIAVDTERFKPDKKCEMIIRSELSIDDETIVLLYAGDLTPTRGVEFFISIVKYFAKHYQVKGLIPLKDSNVNINRYNYVTSLLKKSGIEKYVEILSYRDDINCIINSSNIVIMPLRNNYGFMDLPRFLLEAMSCGKPVITTTVGAITDVLYNWVNGVLCEPDDLKCFITSVKTLIENPSLRYNLGENARKTILETFDAKKVSDKLLWIYINLMEK